MSFEKLMRKPKSCVLPGRAVEKQPNSCGFTAGSYPVRLQRTWLAHYLINEPNERDFSRGWLKSKSKGTGEKR
jgi:hypothetical protein